MNSCLHNFHHLLDDKLSVGGLCVACGLDLLLGSLGEGNTEESQDETIGGLGLNAGLDHGVPLFNHRASLISGDVHAIEVSVAIESFNFVNLELHLSPGLGLGVSVTVSERDGVDTTFQTVRCLLLSSSLVARRHGDASLIESWGKDVVPFLLNEWMGAIKREVRNWLLKWFVLTVHSIVGSVFDSTFNASNFQF